MGPHFVGTIYSTAAVNGLDIYSIVGLNSELLIFIDETLNKYL